MENKFTMAIGGDFVATDLNRDFLVAGDADRAFNDVADLFRGADFSFMNVECALTKRGTPIEKCGPNIRSDPECLSTLKNLGVGLIGFANNHSLDFGKAGLEDSIAAAKEYGIPYIGGGMSREEARKPYVFEKNGVKCCIIDVAENEATISSPTRAGANPYDPFDTMEDIENAKKAGYKVIVIYHGGKELYNVTSPKTRRRLRKMAERGADFVFAQHTHCICCHEEYMGAQICYGQANTLFIRETHKNNPLLNRGILPVITVGDKNEVVFHPFIVDVPNGCIRLAKGKDYDDVMIPFEQRSAILHDEKKFMECWEKFMVPCGKEHLEFIAKLDENGMTTDPHTMSVVANFLRCEIHNEVLQDYAAYMLEKHYGALKLKGQE